MNKFATRLILHYPCHLPALGFHWICVHLGRHLSEHSKAPEEQGLLPGEAGILASFPGRKGTLVSCRLIELVLKKVQRGTLSVVNLLGSGCFWDLNVFSLFPEKTFSQ